MNRFLKNTITLLVICMATLPANTQNPPNSNVDITECDSQSCFAIKFKSCEPASFKIVTRMGTAKYEILGKEDDGCRVRLIYLDNPNPDWENKPLICTYDNSFDFKVAAKQAFLAALQETGKNNCEGALLNVM